MRIVKYIPVLIATFSFILIHIFGNAQGISSFSTDLPLIIIDTEGKIIDHELNSPFVYLRMLVGYYPSRNASSSEQVTLGAPTLFIFGCSSPRVDAIRVNPEVQETINVK